MYQLYTIPGSCSTGIHALLNQLDLPFEICKRDDCPDYRQLVPSNQVPALQTDQRLLTEGAAIVLHLLERHTDGELLKDAEFIRWLMFNYATLHPAYSKLFAVNANMQEGQEKTLLMQKMADRVTELWAIVDRHLEGRTSMHTAGISVLDYLLAVYLRWGNLFSEYRIPVGKNVLALVSRVAERPEFQKAFAREGAEYHIPQNALAA